MKPSWIMTGAVAAALASCSPFEGGARRLSRAPDVPAAAGSVRFASTAARDTIIELRVKRLLDPERLNPPGYAYVAWVQGSSDDPPQNIGSLNLDERFDGELTALTELQRFELFVTAETTSDAALPAGPRLLWAERD